MTKISALPQDSTPTASDSIPTYDVETTTTKRSLISDLITLFFNNIPSTSGIRNGWTTGLTAPNTITNNGNRNYSLVFNSTDLTGTLSPGMRLRLTRTVTAPTLCTSLNGTSQYYSKTTPAGMTFTDDFVASAWVKLSSYNGTNNSIISRYNGTSGWDLRIDSGGRIVMSGYNAGSANESNVTSFASVPLNRWVHVAAQLDMSAFTATTVTSYIMIDGIDTPAVVARAGTNPTALIQAGDLQVGARNAGTQFFAGKIAQAAVYSAKVTQATIAAAMSQTLAGTETSLISAYSFNNSINDLNTTSANNLTANGAAAANNADSPFALGSLATTAYTAGTTEFGIVQTIVFSTNTTVVVQAPVNGSIPTSGGISAAAYSAYKSPLGFPSSVGSWVIETIIKNAGSQSSAVAGTWYWPGSASITIPIGAWQSVYEMYMSWSRTAGGTPAGGYMTLSTNGGFLESDVEQTSYGRYDVGGGTSASMELIMKREKFLTVTTQAPYYLIAKMDAVSTSTITIGNSALAGSIRVVNALL